MLIGASGILARGADKYTIYWTSAGFKAYLDDLVYNGHRLAAILGAMTYALGSAKLKFIPGA